MEAIWVALAGMIVYLDTTAVGQFMICQPLVACPLWGIITGRPELGLLFGVGFQLLSLGSLPAGAAKFPEGNVGALTATALAISLAPAEGAAARVVITAAIVWGIVAAHAGAEVTVLVRRFLGGYSERVAAAAAAGQEARFGLLFAGAIGVHALAGFAFTAAAFLIGKLAVLIVLGLVVSGGLPPALSPEPALLGAGVAVVLSRFVHLRGLGVFGLSLVLVLGAGLLWR